MIDLDNRRTPGDSQASFEAALAPLREQLAAHRVYGVVRDDKSLRLFMKAHVFAVWDFQSLLKALQNHLTCVSVPWVPTLQPEARRLVNEIVLDEESDRAPSGGFLSHYEIYLNAMGECGADVVPIQAFLARVRDGVEMEDALGDPLVPSGVASFVCTTMGIARSNQAHCIAAAFAYGREDIIPLMFRKLVWQLSEVSPTSWTTLRYYLDLHIGIDVEQHGPHAKKLVHQLCGDDPALWGQSLEAAQTALRARLCLWDRVAATLAPE